MKKVIFILMILLLTVGAIFSKEEDETISDISETKDFVKDKFKEDKEGNTLSIKKGEGFDFKVPEIVIKGQIDTKIILNKEMKILEDLQNIKNILYEKEKVYLPEQYVKEEKVTFIKNGIKAEKDFLTKIKISFGSYENIFAEGILGKLLDGNSNFILTTSYNSFKNEIINDRITNRNKINVMAFYKTKYDFLDAAYIVDTNFDRFENPFPTNIFSNLYILDDIVVNANFAANINENDVFVKFKYNYYANCNGNYKYIYKENRFTNNINYLKDFLIRDSYKLRFISEISYYISNIFINHNIFDKNFNIDALIKGVFDFEKIIFQGGVKLHNFYFNKNFFKATPYFNIDYEFLPYLTLYGIFKPEMKSPDFISIKDKPFLIANEDVKPSFDSVFLETGININLFQLNSKIYYIYKSTQNHIIIDEMDNTHIFSFYNKNISFWQTGIVLETIKTGNFNFMINYEFTDIIEKSGNITYMPKNSIIVESKFNNSDWQFDIKTYGTTSYYGTTKDILPSFLNINLLLSKKVTNNIALYGYINNLLNNTDYLLYYYKQKGINLGIGSIIKF